VFCSISMGIWGCSSCKFCGQYFDSNSWYVFMNIHEDRTYSVAFYQYNQPYLHEGTWRRFGKRLILNSFAQPTTGDLIDYQLSFDPSIPDDSIEIKIRKIPTDASQDHSDTLMVLYPRTVYLNDEPHYVLNRNDFKVHFSEVLRRISVIGFFTDYPACNVNQRRVNSIEIYFEDIPSDRKLYPYPSYFTNEEIHITPDTLFYLETIPLVRKTERLD